MHGGQPLMFSTFKKKCPERDTCKFFDKQCESSAIQNTSINHLLFSSEEIDGENIWEKLSPGELIAVDDEMKFSKFRVALDFI